MKAKRLTALALAALMAASTTSVALASEKVEYDLDFKQDGYYRYDEDEGRIVKADPGYTFAPGEKIYVRVEENTQGTKFSNKKSYDAYAEWKLGGSWVKDIDLVYKKGEVATSTTTTYDWSFNGKGILDGWTAGNKGLASKDEAQIKADLKKDAANVGKCAAKYIDGKYTKIPATDNAWTDNQGRYWKNETSAKAGNNITGNITTWTIDGVQLDKTYSSKPELVADKLTQITVDDLVYNNKVYHSVDALVKELAQSKTTNIYVNTANVSKAFGNQDSFKDNKVPTNFDQEISAYVFEVGGQKYYVKADQVNAVTQDNLVTDLAISQIKKGENETANYYVKNEDTYVADSSIQSKTKTVTDQMNEKGVKQVSGDKYINKAGKEGDLFVTIDVDKEAKDAVNAAIDSATIDWNTNTVTDTTPQYEYWVEISTKSSNSTKENDLVGTLYTGTNKNSAKNGDSFRLEVTLSNQSNNSGNKNDYKDATDHVTIKDGERAIVSFAGDASDEFEVEFGDDARFVFNARGQSKLNLAYNTKYNKDFAYDYDDANIDFLTFEGEPTTNRTGTLYIYADEDSYIYEVTSKGAKKINGAYYDDDEGAWVIRTRNLTSYAISDKKLKTVNQTNNSSSSNSSNKPDSSNNKPGSSNNKPGNGKPNPDTGR